MDPQAAFGFKDLLSSIIGDMAKAVSDRSGETPDQHFARTQAAVHMILGLLPRDVIEAMLAGHCVMMHETMIATVASTLRDDADKIVRASSNLVRLNKAFNDNLDRLERYRQRPAEGSTDMPETQPAKARVEVGSAPMPTELAVPLQPGAVAHGPNRAARRQAARAASRASTMAPHAAARPGPVAPTAAVLPASARSIADRPAQASPTGTFYMPSPDAIAACEANSEAMAALKSGDAASFARALGVAHPCDGFLAAAGAPGSPFDPQTSGPWPLAASPNN